MKKYLSRYAEPEIALAEEIHESYSDVIVIPLCKEDPSILDPLSALELSDGRALAILVVNESSAADSEVSRVNAKFLEEVERRQARSLGTAFLLRGATDVVVIDRSRGGRSLGAREGVGRARKIGCDLAAALHRQGAIGSPWIHTSDADAQVDANRFLAVREADRRHANLAAVTLPFRHEGGDDSLSRAGVFYEIELRYLVAGLRMAESPFAFHSIGSTLAIRTHSYAKVRGFPNRQAGEDFHVLDKLAKTGVIAQPPGVPVLLRLRHSDRVPFGTGPALRRIAATLSEGEPPALLSSKCFTALARWIRAMDRYAVHGRLAMFQSEAGEREVDRALGASRAFAHLARGNEPGPGLRRHLHTWFDGLRTIQFLHRVRDREHGTMPWNEAIQEATFLRGFERSDSPEDALERLRALEQGPFLSGLGVIEES